MDYKFNFLLLQRITVPEILEDEWFKKDYKPPVFEENKIANLDDVEAVFKDSEVCQIWLHEHFSDVWVFYYRFVAHNLSMLINFFHRSIMWQRRRKNSQ